MNLVSGKVAEVLVEYTNTSPPNAPEKDDSQPALMRGVVSVDFTLGGFTSTGIHSALVVVRKLTQKRRLRMQSHWPPNQTWLYSSVV